MKSVLVEYQYCLTLYLMFEIDLRLYFDIVLNLPLYGQRK